MDEIKQVNVTLSNQDEKSLSRAAKGITRKRKGSKKDAVVSTPEVDKVEITEIAPIPVPDPVPVPATQPPPLPSPAPIVVPAPSPPPTVPSVPVIKIQSKKPLSQTPLSPKIIHTKKRNSSAPAVVQTKSKLVVPKHDPLPKSEMSPAKNSVGGGKAIKRNYTERKISIQVTPTAKKFKRTLKNKIASMPIELVKKTLLAKGVIKPKKDGKYPPEAMLRSMMRDILDTTV
jgi:hypothetical protein